MCCPSSTKKSSTFPGPSGSNPPKSVKKDCPECCKLVSLTVIKNATQTNVTGARNWAAVKKSSDDVIVEATTTPNTEDCWQKINWSGDSGSAVPGKSNQRKLSRASSKKVHVEAELGGVKDSVDVWIIWADLEVKIDSGDTIDTGNDASGLAADHKWPARFGGGNKLGPISKEGTSLTYAYTVGKMQAKATLTPAGVENVISRSAWHMKRKKSKKAFDNGVRTRNVSNEDDTSHASWVDEDPKSGTSTREIYDLDGPGCSNTKTGTAVDHTAELYQNFWQYVTVTLDSEEQCSDNQLWSYEAAVDVDKATGKVEANTLRLSHIEVDTRTSRYTTR
jgi:hypothetical protein